MAVINETEESKAAARELYEHGRKLLEEKGVVFYHCDGCGISLSQIGMRIITTGEHETNICPECLATAMKWLIKAAL